MGNPRRRSGAWWSRALRLLENRGKGTIGLRDFIKEREEIERGLKAKKEALQLEREATIRKYDNEMLFKKSKVDIEKAKEIVDPWTNEEIVQRAMENLTEVIRIARVSSNLNGTFQKALKVAAASSIGCVEVLKERATMTPGEVHADEIRTLKKEVMTLRTRLEEEVEAEKRKALEAAGEAHAYHEELRMLKGERRKERTRVVSTERESSVRKGQKESPKKAARKIVEARIQAQSNRVSSDTEAMEVMEESPKVILDPPEEWEPVRRLLLRGKRKIMDEDLEENKRIYSPRTHRRKKYG